MCNCKGYDYILYINLNTLRREKMNTIKANLLKKIEDAQDIIRFYKDFYNRLNHPKKRIFLKQLNEESRRIKFSKLLLLISKKITKIYIFKTSFKNMRPKKIKSIIEKLKKENISVFKIDKHFYINELNIGGETYGLWTREVKNITEARLTDILSRYKFWIKISKKDTI